MPPTLTNRNSLLHAIHLLIVDCSVNGFDIDFVIYIAAADREKHDTNFLNLFAYYKFNSIALPQGICH